MKVFLSHSSKNKPYVREIKNYLLEDGNIESWIDEIELHCGDETEESIKEAIETESDFVIVFLDRDALESNWVRKELDWALDKEGNLPRTFLIPVVLERDILKEVGTEIKKQHYIEAYGYGTKDIRGLARKLAAELHALLSRDFKQALTVIRKSNELLDSVAKEIREIVFPYRKDKPISLGVLLEKFNKNRRKPLDRDEFLYLLKKVQEEKKHLAGYVWQGDKIYVEEEHYTWKITTNTSEKKEIAIKAVSEIKPGMKIIIDSGSTTFEIACEIAGKLKIQALNKLTVITNSIPAANKFLETASELGLEDKNNVLDVYTIGGRVRSNTQAIVRAEKIKERDAVTDFKTILKSLGGADLAFVGTNGVYEDVGFTTESESEMETKQVMLENAKKRFIVTDLSKFGLRQKNVFATFDQKIEIITTREGDNDRLRYYEKYLKSKNTSLAYA